MYKSYSEIGVSEEKNQDQYAILELINQEQKNDIINSHRVVLIDIFANWCGPCKQIAPSYALLAMKYSKPTICAVVKQQFDSVEEDIKNKIQGIPLFLYYINGELKDKVIGADLNEVENKLQSILSDVMKNLKPNENVNNPPPQFKSNIRSSKGFIPDFSNDRMPYQSTSTSIPTPSPSPSPYSPEYTRAPYPPTNNRFNSLINSHGQNPSSGFGHNQNATSKPEYPNTNNPTYSVRYN